MKGGSLETKEHRSGGGEGEVHQDARGGPGMKGASGKTTVGQGGPDRVWERGYKCGLAPWAMGSHSKNASRQEHEWNCAPEGPL